MTAYTEKQIASMFDKIAPRYDFLNGLLSFNRDKAWRRKMISMIPSTPQGTFLDVATGTGDVIIAACRSHIEYGAFTGVDISAQMLERAHAKSTSLPITYRVMSAEALDIPSASVDCITIAFGLRNVINKRQALAEFSRVLKPNGALLILEFFPPQGTILARAFRLYFHHVLPRIGALLSDRAAYRYLPTSVDQFFSLPALGAALHENDLLVDSTRRFLFGSCVLLSAKKST